MTATEPVLCEAGRFAKVFADPSPSHRPMVDRRYHTVHAESPIAEMPPSITQESLERNTSADSFQSSSIEAMSRSHPQIEAERNYNGMNDYKSSPSYRAYGDYAEEGEDDGCGDMALLERPSWTESLRRLKKCCPGIPGVPNKSDMEQRVRSQSESTDSSRSSRQLSPVPVAPAYHCDVHQQMPYPPHPQAGWYAAPPPGYSPGPYLPQAYAAWGYPHPGATPYAVPSQHNGMLYPPPPPHLLHSRTYGYVADPSPPRKNTAPEPYLGHEDSGTESEVSSLQGSSHRRGASKSKQQRRLSKPPLVQRRATAPVQSSSVPLSSSTHKESIDHPLMPPPLPPKQPSRKNVMAGSRPRLPSEMSRTSVNTTNSRHRRQAHETFEFSTNSLREIGSEGPIPVGPPPLNFIELQTSSFQRQNSWSSWDDQTHNDDDNSMLLSPDEDELACYISPDDDSPARAKVSPARSQPDDWMLKWADEKPATESPTSPELSRTSRLSEAPDVPTKDTSKGPIYLPLSDDLDKAVVDAGGTVVFSGWVAISEGDSMRNKLGMAEDNEVPIEHKDINYLQLVQEDAHKYLKIHLSEGEIKIVPLSRSLQAQGQEVNGRAGRCVLLQDAWTRQIQWTILPVSLPSYFFRQGRLLSERNFALLQSAMFTPFYNATTGTPQEWSEEFVARRYAPDEQHDAAMHILFCMDAALSTAH